MKSSTKESDLNENDIWIKTVANISEIEIEKKKMKEGGKKKEGNKEKKRKRRRRRGRGKGEGRGRLGEECKTNIDFTLNTVPSPENKITIRPWLC